MQVYSKNVKRLVCSTFMARVASCASMTQDMLISLAPGLLEGYSAEG